MASIKIKKNPMDTQDPSVSTPTPAPAQPKAAPDFPDLAKASFQFLRQFWLSYFKLGFLLAIPAIIGFLVIGFFFFSSFLQSALGFGGFEAHAAPAIPSRIEVTAAPTPPPAAVEPSPDVVVPAETVPGSDSPAEAPAQNIPETTTPDVAPLAKEKRDAILGSPEDVGVPLPYNAPDVEVLRLPKDNPLPRFSALSGLLGMGGLIVLPVVFGLLVVLYQLIVMLSFTRLTVVLEKNEYVGAMPVVRWAIKHSGTYLSLVLRIFVYSTLWIPVVAIFAAPILGFLSGAGILPASAMMIVNYVLGLAALLSIPLALIRTPRTLFAQFVLADRECGSKEALDHSVEISIGHWWQIVIYLVGIGIVASLTSGILTSVIGKISPVAGGLVSIAFSFLITFYMVIFNYGLFHLLESQFRTQK